MAKIKQIITNFIKIIFSVGLIYWLINSGKLDFSTLGPLLSPKPIFIGLSAVGFIFALTSERWRCLLKSQNLAIPASLGAKLTLIGIFFNFSMPGGVGGDLVKGYYITKAHPDSKLTAAVTVIMDRVIGLFAMVLMALLTMIANFEITTSNPNLMHILWGLTALAILFFIFWLVIIFNLNSLRKLIILIAQQLPKRLRIDQATIIIFSYGRNKSYLFCAIAYSLLSQFLAIYFFIFVSQTLGFQDLPNSLFFFVIPLSFIVQAVPISPAGIGIGQTASFFLFEAASPGSGHIGPSTMTAFQISQFIFAIFGAMFYLQIGKKDQQNIKRIIN